jgi:hypothetical protein
LGAIDCPGAAYHCWKSYISYFSIFDLVPLGWNSIMNNPDDYIGGANEEGWHMWENPYTTH